MSYRDGFLILCLLLLLSIIMLVDNAQKRDWEQDILNTEGPPPRVGADAPTFQAAESSGQVIGSADFAGESIVLVLWSPNCPPSIRLLEDLNSQLQADAKVLPTVVAICITGNHTQVTQEYAMQGIAFEPLTDHQRHTKWNYNASTLPATYLIDSQGVIIYRQTGYNLEIVNTILSFKY